MSDKGSVSRRDTLETYSNLVQLEVRSLTSRLAEMAVEISAFTENFGAILLEIEGLTQRVDAIQGGMDFCRSEVAEFRRMILELENKVQAAVAAVAAAQAAKEAGS